MTVSSIQHPDLLERAVEYEKFRRCYESGFLFVDRYLEKFSKRESHQDFIKRKFVTYNPAFAKAAVNEVKNAVFQRLQDVSRIGGPSSYQDACVGKSGGIDRLSSSMTTFIGKNVLPELLSMGKVGVWVDRMPIPDDATLSEVQDNPYLYIYRIEDVRSWTYVDGGNQGQFQSILLCDWDYVSSDSRFGLPNGWKESYRYAYIHEDGFVRVETHQLGQSEPVEVKLNLKQIPFVLVDIGASLLKDVASYQIAMLNMASADVNYAVKANFPFYTEQRDARQETPHLRPATQKAPNPNPNLVPAPGTAASASEAKTEEVSVGSVGGRFYSQNMERPGFINPSDVPLRVSMDKQLQMKQEIRELVHLAVSSVGSSAEAKTLDNQGLNNGLSAIALELELMERRVGEIWGAYESSEPPSVRYPVVWTMQSDDERRQEAEALLKHMDAVPSKTYAKAIAKMAAEKLVGHRISDEVLATINAEIDAADAVTPKSAELLLDVQQGLVSADTASGLRGYAKGEVSKAQDEQAKRLAIIAIAQTQGAGAARGVSDASVLPSVETGMEKQTASGDIGPPTVRGQGKSLLGTKADEL